MQNYGMEVVKVDKTKLLKILRANRDEHRSIFLESLDGYHKAALKALQERIEDAKNNNKKVSLIFALEQPQDQTKQYSRVIKMLEMSIDDEVKLTQQEFANYVMDDWSWMDQFLTSNSGYSQRAATKISTRY